MMLKISNNVDAFFALIRAGLWEKEIQLSSLGQIDFMEVYRLSEEQSVVGLVAAGLDHIKDLKAPQEYALQFVGSALQLEQRNQSMNIFVAKLIEQLRQQDVYALLVKGQGIAQCYERPLWRASGDIDLYLSKNNYGKAKNLLMPKAQDVEDEDKKLLHLGMTLDGWMVELHGTMHSKLSRKMNRVADEVHSDIFYNGCVRSWNNNGVQIFLPSADNDAIIIFNHFISHFFLEGVGLRQICDWCRLLWVYKDRINKPLLESRLQRMHMLDKWRAFAAMAVDYLGMPVDAMPFYNPSKKWKKKADGIIALILESGNFGHAVDKSYKHRYPAIIRAIKATCHHTSVAFRHFRIFPYTSFLGWTKLMYIGVRANLKKK